MNKDEHKTKVVFKKFPEGDIIALMPEEKYQLDQETSIMSYMHIGQHGDACPSLVKELDAATPSEYYDLKQELESLGYNLKVSK